MTRADWILAVAIVVVAAISLPVMAAASGSDADSIEVTGPAGVTRLDLDVDGVATVEGLDGELTLEVSRGVVRVTGSSCPDQICVQSGGIDSRGGVIACIPNGVTILVGRDGEGELDAVVR